MRQTRARAAAGRAAALSLALLPACGGGGGGGLVFPGGPTAPETGDHRIQVLEEASYLVRPLADVRTVYLARLQLSDAQDEPVVGLTTKDFRFVRDGNPASSENAGTPSGVLSKVDVALCLDNSKSIAVDQANQPSPENVELLRQSATAFADGLAPSANRLRIYRFSTSSRTGLVGVYLSDGAVWEADAETGQTPAEAIAASIDPDPVLDNGTALFESLEMAFQADPERDDLTVLLSDGVEEGSAPGSQEAALDLIEEDRLVVYSIGVGNVDPDELEKISAHGDTFLSDTFAGVEALFGRVAKEVESIYTVIYDTPLQEGRHDLELLIDVGEETLRYATEFLAGVDLATSVYHMPLAPGSSATYVTSGGVLPKTTLRVLPLDEARASPDTGVLHLAVESSLVPGEPSFFVAPYGDGARTDLPDLPPRLLHMPPEVAVGTTWKTTDGPGSSAYQNVVVAIQDVEVRGHDYPGCAVVDTVDPATGNVIGTRWVQRGAGVVRQVDNVTGLVQELEAPPKAGATF